MQLLTGNPTPFAIMYTLGNVTGFTAPSSRKHLILFLIHPFFLAMCSTCFLFGPYTQAKKMLSSERLAATSVYFSMMGLTLFLAFFPGNIPLRVLWLVIAIILQFLALGELILSIFAVFIWSIFLCSFPPVWYTISYIPFAREMMKTCLCDTCCKGGECFKE